jgi:hypothetical protein
MDVYACFMLVNINYSMIMKMITAPVVLRSSRIEWVGAGNSQRFAYLSRCVLPFFFKHSGVGHSIWAIFGQ